jgi:ssDNA-binding replication factor A large subunit
VRQIDNVTAKETIQEILLKCPEITEEKILEVLKTEKSKTGGLIADETLLRLIGARYGIETVREVAKSKLSINQLVPGLNKVTVSGRIVAIYPVKAFEGKQSGKYTSLIIADKNGILRVMLWNGKADLVESAVVKMGQIVQFLCCYTREDRNGNTELHVSEKGKVMVNPEDAESTFTRQDSSVGRVLRFIIADNTGEIMVVSWNEKAEELEPVLKKDVQVRLVNAKAKESSNGLLEVHADATTYTEVI